MSLTVTNLNILNALGNDVPAGIACIAKRDIRDIKASYAITKAIRKCTEHLQGVEKDRRALFAKLCPDGTVTPAFAEAWNVLLADTVTLDGVRAVTLDELAGSGATPEELLLAGPFVIESE